MPDIKNDGGLAFGSQAQSLKFGAGSSDTAIYILESFSLDDGSNTTVTKDENGLPNKQISVSDVPTGNATCQLPDAETPPPLKFQEFDADLVGGGTMTVYIDKVGQTMGNEAVQKVSIGLRKVLNP